MTVEGATATVAGATAVEAKAGERAAAAATVGGATKPTFVNSSAFGGGEAGPGRVCGVRCSRRCPGS